MKKFLVVGVVIFFVFSGAGCLKSPENIESNENAFNNSGLEEKDNVTRKEELELEGFINDYFYRRHIKDPFLFGDYEAYVSLLEKCIFVYLYPKNDTARKISDSFKETIEKDLQEQLFDFPDFTWTQNYKFYVVIR